MQSKILRSENKGKMHSFYHQRTQDEQGGRHIKSIINMHPGKFCSVPSMMETLDPALNSWGNHKGPGKNGAI